LRFKGSVSVTGRIEFKTTRDGFERFRNLTVFTVARSTGLIGQMSIKFARQSRLNDLFDERRKDAVFATYGASVRQGAYRILKPRWLRLGIS
jgi:hypothetical protein